jgi:hypothetical protein
MYDGEPQTATNANFEFIGATTWMLVLVQMSGSMRETMQWSSEMQRRLSSCEHGHVLFQILGQCIAICGLEGAEVIGTSNGSKMAGQQGNRSQEIIWDEILKDEDLPNRDSQYEGIELLGSETHLIALFRGKIHIFIPGINPLLSYASSVPCVPDLS